MSVTFEAGDLVNLPIQWKGIVIESYWEKVVVRFDNPMFWLKVVKKELFNYGTKERLIKKKKISKDYDEQYFDMHREDQLVLNDMV